jgi:hypothetical protein
MEQAGFTLHDVSAFLSAHLRSQNRGIDVKQRVQRAKVYTTDRFSDHAPLLIDYAYAC